MISTRKFGAETEASEVADHFRDEIVDKTSVEVVITGVSPHGIGEVMCLAIASHRPRLIIITGRDLDRPRTVQADVLARYPNVQLCIVGIDLASNESVKQAADEINQICTAENGCIDVIVNNAGVMCLPERKLTRDNVEMHLQVNYIGHFLLTRLLLDQLAKSPGGGRVVNVSSSAHAISPFRFSDPAFIDAKEMGQNERPFEDACKFYDIPWTLEYLPLIAYGQSKTAQILHSVALSDLTGKGVVANSVNPGVVKTDLWRHMSPEVVTEIFTSLPVKTPSQGAAAVLVAALDPSLREKPGAYLDGCTLGTPANFANDLELAKKLWSWTQERCLLYTQS